ncbi:outer membrane beta-barrel protein [Desulfovibrio sp. OttesenSCG-928-F07]|nr:outer membrane beta-barrel protein [Desulfovibrio sp. OttesenSCG-928-F07]
MNKRVLLIVIATLLLIPSVSFAKSGVYVAPFAGLSNQKVVDPTLSTRYGEAEMDSWKETGFAFGIAAGYDFKVNKTYPIRLELALTVTNGMDEEDGSDYFDINSFTSIMANIWWDIPIEAPVQPYIGAGVGVMIMDCDYQITVPGYARFYGDGTVSAAAFNFGLGIEVPVSDLISVDLGYRFVRTAEFSIDAGNAYGTSHDIEGKGQFHNFIAGARFKF